MILSAIQTIKLGKSEPGASLSECSISLTQKSITLQIFKQLLYIFIIRVRGVHGKMPKQGKAWDTVHAPQQPGNALAVNFCNCLQQLSTAVHLHQRGIVLAGKHYNLDPNEGSARC